MIGHIWKYYWRQICMRDTTGANQDTNNYFDAGGTLSIS